MACEVKACPFENRIDQLEIEVVELNEKRHADNEKFYSRLQDLEKEYVVLKNDVEHIRKTVEEINANLKTLMAAPGKRYETIIACVVTTVVGTIIGIIISGAMHV